MPKGYNYLVKSDIQSSLGSHEIEASGDALWALNYVLSRMSLPSHS